MNNKDLDLTCERWREWQLDCYLEDDDEYDKEEEDERQDLIDKLLKHPMWDRKTTRVDMDLEWSLEACRKELVDLDEALEFYEEEQKSLKLNSENADI